MRHHKAILFKRLTDLLAPDQDESSYTAANENTVDVIANKGIGDDLKQFGTSQGIINVAGGSLHISDEGTVCRFVTSEKKLHEEKQIDLKRYSTPQGIIKVAEIEKKKICVKKPILRVPSNRRDATTYPLDLKRFGTYQGIINVSNDEATKEKPLESPSIKSVSPTSLNPYADRYREFSQAQVTIKNTTGLPKEITLWRKNPYEATGAAGFENIESQVITSTVDVGIHPQGITFNPANNCMYAVNQLSGTVSIVDNNNHLVQTVQLEPSFPGTCSPVSVAVNTNALDANYGTVYIACCISNTIQFLGLNHVVQHTVAVGNRPVHVAYNPVNGLIYSANLADGTISVINQQSVPVVSTVLEAEQGPIGLGVNLGNGDLFCCNSVSNSVSVYSSVNSLVRIIKNTGSRPVSATYNPSNGSMYVAASDSNLLLKVNSETYNLEMYLAVGSQPYNAFYVKDNQYMYVQNREDNTLTVISSADEFLGSLSLGEQNIGGAYNTALQKIYVTNTLNNSINVISFGTSSNGITISTGYNEIQEEFKNNFAIIQHARFVINGNERIYGFKLNRSNATGSLTSRALSMEQFASPQNSQNVIECPALAGSLIDGKTNWKFMLPAYQSVAVLIWFKQFNIESILPKNLTNQNK